MFTCKPAKKTRRKFIINYFVQIFGIPGILAALARLAFQHSGILAFWIPNPSP
jgi:hypothetical protein